MYIHCEDCDATSAFPDNQDDNNNPLAIIEKLHCIYCQSTNITFYDVVHDNVDDDFNFTHCPICKHELDNSVCNNCSKSLPFGGVVIIA